MTVEKGWDLRPVHRRGHELSGDSRGLWSHVGVDVETMSPKVRAVSGVVTGGTILLAAALLVLFTDLWWLIFVFCWIVFPALGTFARGVAGLMESRQEVQLPQDSKERELLEALRDRRELTPAQAAVETSLSVREADEMLKELAEVGHLEVRARGEVCPTRFGTMRETRRGESVGCQPTARFNLALLPRSLVGSPTVPQKDGA